MAGVPSAPSPFCLSLDEAIWIEQCRRAPGCGVDPPPANSSVVPYLLNRLCNAIVAAGGLTTPGVLSNKVDPRELGLVIKNLASGQEQVLGKLNANVLAAVLKAWLRELAVPLIPSALIPRILAVSKSRDPVEAARIMAKFPPSHRAVMHAIVELCARVARNPSSHMDAQSCGRALGASIVGTLAGTPPESVTASAAAFLAFAIGEHVRGSAG